MVKLWEISTGRTLVKYTGNDNLLLIVPTAARVWVPSGPVTHTGIRCGIYQASSLGCQWGDITEMIITGGAEVHTGNLAGPGPTSTAKHGMTGPEEPAECREQDWTVQIWEELLY